MFWLQVPGVKGTMVSNAHPELRQWVEANPSPNIFQVLAMILPSSFPTNQQDVCCLETERCEYDCCRQT